MIRASGAHIVLLQEAAGWCEHNFQQAARAERDLGMQVPWDALEPGQSTTMPIRPLWPLR
ncbi:hypothetical protein [Allosalinactinospora lopnorensis]|uniref:hypothetical protein n=1 Tax=Allosalinactinospora lopnorensis TaxID=1352348 RepID=UPI0012E1637A|nr:hypothetical protein [Allosalinactinospora lopnorensis]